MSAGPAPPRSSLIASFFARLVAIEAVVRVILSDARIAAVIALRGERPRKILLDFGPTPARVLHDDPTRPGDIVMDIEDEVLHEILLGRMAPGLALGRRQMLLKGHAANFARFIPLFAFGPVLYREHLADAGVAGFARTTGAAPLQEAVMTETFHGDPIPITKLNWFERGVSRVLNGLAFVLGWCVGQIRYRLVQNLSLFDVLGAMSRGLAAAAPPPKPEQEG